MRIRTKLTLIFFLLAVVPLTGIVFYNYLSSLRTFRQAVEREVRADAEELTARLDAAKADLSNRLRTFATMSLVELSSDDPELAEESMGMQAELELGELAPLVDSVEVIPAAPEPAAPIAPLHIPSELHLSERPEPVELPESFVIYLDQVLEETSTMGTAEALEQARQATEVLLQELDQEDGERRGVLATESELLDEEIALREQEVEELTDAIRDRDLTADERERLREEQAMARRALRKIARQRGLLEEQELDELQAGWERAQDLLGSKFDWKILREGEVLGQLRAQISPANLLGAVLSRVRPDQGEIPFALDGEGEIYTTSAEAGEIIAALDLVTLTGAEDSQEGATRTRMAFQDDWLVVTSPDPDSEVVLGIARPIGESLAAMRTTAARNFGLGLGMITLALMGILPLSTRMTRNLSKLSESVDRMASGSLDIEVDIHSRDEIGSLAKSVSRMAGDLQLNQERLIDEVQRRKEQETRERLLEAENERKSAELEDARRFQLSLLPAQLPSHPELEIAVHMQTATEVGGDYYDFLDGDEGALTIAVGDATGHGAKAGTMVTAIKSLFMARGSHVDPRAFLTESSETVKRMRLGRMAMALSIARFERGRLTVAAAGMPPALLWRHASGAVEELELTGPPLGGILGANYEQLDVSMEPGDVLLLMTDGFPELPDPDGDPLGYGEVARRFGEIADRGPSGVIAGLNETADRWRRDQPLIDDITFVVARRTG